MYIDIVPQFASKVNTKQNTKIISNVSEVAGGRTATPVPAPRSTEYNPPALLSVSPSGYKNQLVGALTVYPTGFVEIAEKEFRVNWTVLESALLIRQSASVVLVLRLFVGYNQDVEWQNERSTGRDSRETAEFEQTVTKESGGEVRGLRFQSDEQNYI